MTFNQVLVQAVQRPLVRAAQAQAEAAGSEAEAAFRQAWLPDLKAGYSIRERDRDLQLPTPIGDLPLGEGSWQNFSARLTQPLFDPPRALYGIKSARERAQAADYLARRRQEEMMAQAGQAYLDVEELVARRSSQEKYIVALEQRVAESEELFQEGRILLAELQKIKLALANARQEDLELEQGYGVACLALGRAVGDDGAIAPSGEVGLPAIVAEKDLLAESERLGDRNDILALQHQVAALTGSAQALRAAAWPRLELQLQWNWTDQELVTPSGWGEGALAVVWNPLAGGSRLAQARARLADARALSENLQELRQGINLELARARAAALVAQGAISLSQTAIAQALEYRRVMGKRFLAGYATTSHLLEAEADLHRQRSASLVAAINLQRARLAYCLAAGNLRSRLDNP